MDLKIELNEEELNRMTIGIDHFTVCQLSDQASEWQRGWS